MRPAFSLTRKKRLLDAERPHERGGRNEEVTHCTASARNVALVAAFARTIERSLTRPIECGLPRRRTPTRARCLSLSLCEFSSPFSRFCRRRCSSPAIIVAVSRPRVAHVVLRWGGGAVRASKGVPPRDPPPSQLSHVQVDEVHNVWYFVNVLVVP